MEKIDSQDMFPHVPLFNSPIETGVRTLVILNAAYPISLDLTQLTWLDHLVVHTGDIDGPESLHPNLPQRNGEILVRRSLVEEGITLMRRLHLVSTEVNDRGVTYFATDEAYPFVDLMKTEYATRLKVRAIWLADNVLPRGDKALHDLIADKLGRWNIEFQDKQATMGRQ
jgi:hypothetical protein